MGFGLQKWIYTQGPRKAFSMERKPSCDALPKYSRKFKIQPSKKNPTIDTMIPIVLSLLFILFSWLCIDFFKKEANETQQIYNERIERENTEAFQFLVGSGKWRLEKQRYNGALSRFELAQNINPNSQELISLIEIVQFKIDSVKKVGN